MKYIKQYIEWYVEHGGNNDGAISTLRILPLFAQQNIKLRWTHMWICTHAHTHMCVMQHWRYPLTIICTIRHYVHVFDTKFRVHYQNAFIKLSTLHSTRNISEIMIHLLMRILTKSVRDLWELIRSLNAE